MSASSQRWDTPFYPNILKNRGVFERTVDIIEILERCGKAQDACLLATYIIQYTWPNITGYRASPRLERCLTKLGQRLSVSRKPTKKTNGSPHHVLHVLTVEYTTGGHTRVIKNWIQNDVAHRHSLVVTRQKEASFPSFLAEAVEQNGGTVSLLHEGLFLDQAHELRQIASMADFIVLHIHADDIVPHLAFANHAYLPPILYFNHADHIFWVGASISNIVVEFNHCGHFMSTSRRGIAPANLAMLPLPLDPPVRHHSRAQAKQKLGLREDELLLLCVASSYKFAHINDQMDFLNFHLEIVKKNPKVRLWIVGPEPSAYWQKAEQDSEGRIRIISATPELALYYEATDIFTNGIPFGGTTAVLEAASYGIPVFSARYEDVDEPDQHRPNSPTIDDIICKPIGQTAYQAELQKFIDDAGLRERTGQIIFERIKEHIAPAWQNTVNTVYKKAETAPIISFSETSFPVNSTDALLMAVHHLASGIPQKDAASFDAVLIGSLPRLSHSGEFLTLLFGGMVSKKLRNSLLKEVIRKALLRLKAKIIRQLKR